MRFSGFVRGGCVALAVFLVAGCADRGNNVAEEPSVDEVAETPNARDTASSGPPTTQVWDPEEHIDELEGAAAVLQREAQERWPADYAGLWLDSGVIWIAFTTDAETKVAELREEVPEHHDVRAVQAERSLEPLRELQRTMVRDRTALQDGDPPPDMPQEIRATQGRYDLIIDTKTQVVEVAVERLSRDLRQAFINYYDTKALSFSEGIGQPD